MTEEQWLSSAEPAKMLRGTIGVGAIGSKGEMRPSPANGYKFEAWVEACQRKANPSIDWNPLDKWNLWAWANPNEWDATCPLAWRADALRDIVGNPWKPVTLSLAAVGPVVAVRTHDGMLLMETGYDLAYKCPWLTPDVRTLAQCLDRCLGKDGTLDNDGLAALSDAIVEAGCDDGAIIGHLRASKFHVRGCHVLTLLLQKE